jgi:hypothetical protein
VCKKGYLESDCDDGKKGEEKVIFIDGVDGCLPCVTMRLDNLTKGEYYILYRPDFKKFHMVKKINVVFYSEFYMRKTASEVAEIDRVNKKLKAGGYDEIRGGLEKKVLIPAESKPELVSGRPITPE